MRSVSMASRCRRLWLASSRLPSNPNPNPNPNPSPQTQTCPPRFSNLSSYSNVSCPISHSPDNSHPRFAFAPFQLKSVLSGRSVNWAFEFDQRAVTGATEAAFTRFYSSSSESKELESESELTRSKKPEFKHQEIEGPTVERDASPLADETREVSERLMKTMYDLSKLLALLGLSQLASGAWFISYSDSAATSSSTTTTLMWVSSVVAFALPFSMAFLLRQSLKSMHFFHKMEQMGRLQILTSIMQITKHLHLFFIRLRVVSYLCLGLLPLSFVLHLLSSSSSS